MYTANILVAEDEDLLRNLVKKYLVREGYNVLEALDGRIACEIFDTEHIDIILLDVMMPNMDGWEVCREIRSKSSVPIIMMTARSEEYDKITGFELGVDQYVTKPFNTKELMARVKSILKKNRNIIAGERTEIGDIIIDIQSHQAYIKDKEIELSPKEYDLLLYLIDNKNKALSRQMILDRVWGYDYFGDSRTVDSHIKRLRKKLGEEGETIKTIHGMGYKFEVKG